MTVGCAECVCVRGILQEPVFGGGLTATERSCFLQDNVGELIN